MAREALRRNFRGCSIRVSMPRNHTYKALHVKYRCVGVSPSANFRVDCSALEKRENFPLYAIVRSFRGARSIHAYIIHYIRDECKSYSV